MDPPFSGRFLAVLLVVFDSFTVFLTIDASGALDMLVRMDWRGNHSLGYVKIETFQVFRCSVWFLRLWLD
ncbi:hypothetical protein BHE74_00046830 [Ensete ventricosum]|nr:hypothetical protein GW17_00050833 [Ensete ventricosum]RWW47204.1 hypothetical protein BHE74_00046830 [Ensete ventricosum]RZS20294.1 hypothetical protein BHM03_00052786 [Ensete ventricosum]